MCKLKVGTLIAPTPAKTIRILIVMLYFKVVEALQKAGADARPYHAKMSNKLRTEVHRSIIKYTTMFSALDLSVPFNCSLVFANLRM